MQAFLGQLGLLWKHAYMMRRYASRFVCRKGSTKICIEGYPRSANTFAVRMFSSANEGHVAHHTHSERNIELALAYGIPVVVLLRDPLDAIASAWIYRKRGIDFETGSWLSFHQYVAPRREAVVIARFEVVTELFNRVIRSVNRRFDTDFDQIEDIAVAEKRVIEDILAATARDGKGFDRVPLPSTERDALKAQHRSCIERHASYAAIRTLYESLLESANDP